MRPIATARLLGIACSCLAAGPLGLAACSLETGFQNDLLIPVVPYSVPTPGPALWYWDEIDAQAGDGLRVGPIDYAARIADRDEVFPIDNMDLGRTQPRKLSWILAVVTATNRTSVSARVASLSFLDQDGHEHTATRLDLPEPSAEGLVIPGGETRIFRVRAQVWDWRHRFALLVDDHAGAVRGLPLAFRPFPVPDDWRLGCDDGEATQKEDVSSTAPP